MSFILDALKKSESERQRQSGPALLEMRIVRPSRALPAWAMVVGALLILSVGVLAWMALRPAHNSNDLSRSTNAGAAAGAVAGHAVPQAPAAPPAVAANGAGASANTAGAPDATDTADGTDVEAPVNPADNAPAVAANPGSPAPAATHDNLPGYAALNGTVPELRLDLHVYAQNPADRYAFINMHKVREGDTTPEGVQVRQITREGVVLEYQGAEFLLGR